jgi:hypothetical protein
LNCSLLRDIGGSHGCECGDCSLVGRGAGQSVRKLRIFRRNLLHPSLRYKTDDSRMKMAAAGFSETLVASYPTTRRHVPENYNLHIRCLFKLTKSQMNIFIKTVTNVKASLIIVTIHNERTVNSE